jgi:hypothetical protein
MVIDDADLDRMAGELIATHGPQAARVATGQLNAMIDRDDIGGREVWACLVHLIHQRQGTDGDRDTSVRFWSGPRSDGASDGT